PQSALYCGWYSLGKYVDAFDWQRGAVGYHIASSECTTLKKEGSQVWCKRMLEDGVAATIGPVTEPYVQGFPLPELFFGFLLDGYYTLAESYFLSLPYLSWQMVLIGDPLYRPFRNITSGK
ncbi:MAG: TIGR03790 family protein, partial [Desulfuromusa sp.]|nr:TIGR03790 family protein [Desulfuromusa sp.]